MTKRSSRPILVVGLCAALWGGACTGPAGGSSSGSSGGGSSSGSSGVNPELQAFYDGWISASCDMAERCASVRGRGYSSRQECVAFGTDPLNFRRLLSIYLFVIKDSAAAQACLQAYATMPCDAEEPSECDSAVGFAHIAAAGQACENGFDPDAAHCDSASRCVAQATGSTCWVCQAGLANGQTCSTNAACTSDHCENGMCVPAPAPRTRGETCVLDSDCLGELACIGTCTERVGIGETCSDNCFRDLSCRGGTCVAYRADGQPCSRGASDCRNLCVFPTSDAATGTCATVTSGPAAGEPCLDRGSMGAYYSCVDSYSDSDATGCECRTRLADGQACTSDDSCIHETCALGRCSAPLANGAACGGHDDCASGYCNATCADPPACP